MRAMAWDHNHLMAGGRSENERQDVGFLAVSSSAFWDGILDVGGEFKVASVARTLFAGQHRNVRATSGRWKPTRDSKYLEVLLN